MDKRFRNLNRRPLYRPAGHFPPRGGKERWINRGKVVQGGVEEADRVSSVIPAKAGIQVVFSCPKGGKSKEWRRVAPEGTFLDSRLRGNDGV